MNTEDYFKYYIKGSDHYLIPKDVFDELFDEMESWKQENQKLKADYGNKAQVERDLLLEENERLKDNWNYIKKMLKEARQEEFNINGYCGTCTDVDIDFLLNKMRELERGRINE